MNLLDLMVKIGVDDQASDKIRSIGTGAIAKGVAVGKAVYDITKTVLKGVASVVTGSEQAYAAYEQNVGGVQKLYGNMGKSLEDYAAMTGRSVDDVRGEWSRLEGAQNTVLENAKKAYRTAGMSANQYMEQATSFSASRITSMGDDTQAAADRANMAMVDMSDNVNTFGTSMQDVQNAYQGFAKQNYTMLDNLKLGYGGTKEEMERLIDDANAWGAANGEASDLSIDSFADVVQAIHQIQEKQQIAGTTAREAATTIEGSVNMAKAAWENWLTGLGDDRADVGQLTSELVETVGIAAQNIVPRLGTIIATLIGSIPSLLANLAPTLVSSLGEAFGKAAETVGASVPEKLRPLSDGVGRIFDAIRDSKLGETLGRIFDGVGPKALDVANKIGNMASALSGPLKTALDAASPLIQFAADVISFLGDHIDIVLPIVTGLGAAFATFNVVGTVASLITGLTAAIGLIASPVGIAAVAIAGIVAVIVALATNAGGCRDAVTGAFQAIGDFIGTAAATIGGLLGQIVQSVVDWATQTAQNARQPGSGFLQSVSDFFSQLPARAADFLDMTLANISLWATQTVAKAEEAGSGFISKVVSFFDSLPGKVADLLELAIAKVKFWANQTVAKAEEAGSGFLRSIGNFFSQLPGRVWDYLSTALGDLGSFAGSVWSSAVNAGSNFLSGISGGFWSAVDLVGSIPWRFWNALGDLGGLLYNAGWNIMVGFYNGLVDMWNEVADWVCGIGSWIANNKGPKAYDLALLVPNGGWIMQSLETGMVDRFEGVKRTVAGFAGELQDAMGGEMDLGASVDVSSRPSKGARDRDAKIDRMVSLLEEIADGGDVNMDGGRVSSALTQRSRTTMRGRGYSLA